MFRKVLKKLRGEPGQKKEATPKSSPKKGAPSPKILTAEGWKRLMMKKYRKS
jgi:hypothetical protein